MKKLIYLLFFAILFVSCDDDFVDILPHGKTVPSTTDDLALMLNSTLEVTFAGQNFSYQTDDAIIPDDKFLTHSVAVRNSYTWSDHIYAESEQDNDWVNYYRIISRANYVLQNIDILEEGNEYDKENTRGFALFLRANSYFYLANAYGKHYDPATADTDLAVPLLLEMDINVSEPRSTVQKVYDQIIEDLEKAIPLLIEEPANLRTKASKSSAYALLGRVYLFQGEYGLSQEYSKKALDIYDILTDYNTLFFLNGFNSAHGAGGFDMNINTNKENLFSGYGLDYRVQIFLSPDLSSKLNPATDLRYKFFTSMFDVQFNFLNGQHVAVTDGAWPFSGIKVSEVFLNYCEALMKQDTPDREEALTYLNMLRKKRYDVTTYTDYTSNNDAEVLAEIILERRRELRLTSTRWFDMKRFGVTVTHTINGESFTLTGDSNNYVWAIPLSVMSLNDKLVQNPRGLQ